MKSTVMHSLTYALLKASLPSLALGKSIGRAPAARKAQILVGSMADIPKDGVSGCLPAGPAFGNLSERKVLAVRCSMVDSDSKAEQLGFIPPQSAISVFGGAVGAGGRKEKK